MKDIEDAKIAKEKARIKQELLARLQLYPNEKGFKIDDSWFDGYSENPDYVINPNEGVQISKDMIVNVYKNSDIDES